MAAKKREAYKPGNLSDLAALRIVDPREWEKRIRSAMKDAEGRIPQAAASLGVSTRQLYRILDEPAFTTLDRAPRGKPASR